MHYTNEVVDIPIRLILTDHNIRVSDEELAPSLSENKQIEPIQVYRNKDYYRIIHGHRRYAAAVKLGWETVRAILVFPPEDPAEILIQQLIANRDRKDLSYFEVAQVYKALRDKYGWKQRQIAKRFGTSDAEVSLAISLLEANEAIQQAVEDGRISPSAVEPLLALSKEDQEELAQAAIRAKTTRKVRDLVKTHQRIKDLDKFEAEQESVLPNDIDPLSTLPLVELEEVREHLANIRLMSIRDESVATQVRAVIKMLIKEMQGLYKNFGVVGNGD